MNYLIDNNLNKNLNRFLKENLNLMKEIIF